MSHGSIINGFPNIQNKQIIAHEPLKQEYYFTGNAYSPVVKLTHKESGVTENTYGSNTTFPILTIDNYGHVTSAENSVPVNLLPSPANLPENSTMIVKNGKWTVQQEGWLPIAGTLYYDRTRDPLLDPPSEFSTGRTYKFYDSNGDLVYNNHDNETINAKYADGEIPSVFGNDFLRNFYRVAYADFVEIFPSSDPLTDIPRYYFGVDEDLVYPYLGGSFTTKPQGVDNIDNNYNGRDNSNIILNAILTQHVPTEYPRYIGNILINFPTVWGKLIEKNSDSGFLGYKDWFLPSVKQLKSIGDFMVGTKVTDLGEDRDIAPPKMILLDQKIRDSFKLYCNIYRERNSSWLGYNNYLTSNLQSAENCYCFGFNGTNASSLSSSFGYYHRACFLREI